MNISKIFYISSLLALGFMLIYSTHYIIGSTSGQEKNEKAHAINVVEVGNEVIVSMKIRNTHDGSKNYAYKILIDDKDTYGIGSSLVVLGKKSVEVRASFSRDRLRDKITVLLYDDEKLLKSTNYYVSKGGESHGRNKG